MEYELLRLKVKPGLVRPSVSEVSKLSSRFSRYPITERNIALTVLGPSYVRFPVSANRSASSAPALLVAGAFQLSSVFRYSP